MKYINPIICALDTDNIDLALQLARLLKEKVSMIKLGLEFFAAYGLNGVRKLSEIGIPIFLDLKLHDIPITISRTISVLKSLNISMLTIHISGGKDMIRKSIDTIADSSIKLIGVTILTSLNNHDLNAIGIKHTIKKQVITLTKLARDNNLHGIVCSPNEVSTIRKKCSKDFKIIVPGIRIANSIIATDDQKRTRSPKEAISYGADYIVIGRPITTSSNPVAMVDYILKSISENH